MGEPKILEERSFGKKIIIEKYAPWDKDNRNSWGYDLDLIEIGVENQSSFKGVFARKLNNHYLTGSVGITSLSQRIYEPEEKNEVDKNLHTEILKRANKIKEKETKTIYSLTWHKKNPFLRLQKIKVSPEIIDTTPRGKANQLEIAAVE